MGAPVDNETDNYDSFLKWYEDAVSQVRDVEFVQIPIDMLPEGADIDAYLDPAHPDYQPKDVVLINGRPHLVARSE